MKNVFGFLAGALVGALVGGTVAILLAPSSGEDFRQQIRDKVDYVQEEVKRASDEKRVEMEKQLADLRAPRRPSVTPNV